MRAFGYKLPDFFMEYGPVFAPGGEKPRGEPPPRLGSPRLPGGLRVWDLPNRPLARWRAAEAS